MSTSTPVSDIPLPILTMPVVQGSVNVNANEDLSLMEKKELEAFRLEKAKQKALNKIFYTKIENLTTKQKEKIENFAEMMSKGMMRLDLVDDETRPNQWSYLHQVAWCGAISSCVDLIFKTDEISNSPNDPNLTSFSSTHSLCFSGFQ